MIDELKNRLGKVGGVDTSNFVENVNCVSEYTDYDDQTDPENTCSSP